jgi:hypothetical protein
MHPTLALMIDLFGVRTDDVLAILLAIASVALLVSGVVISQVLRRHVDQRSFPDGPQIDEESYGLWLPARFLTPRGQALRRLSKRLLAAGALVLVVVGCYVHLGLT